MNRVGRPKTVVEVGLGAARAVRPTANRLSYRSPQAAEVGAARRTWKTEVRADAEALVAERCKSHQRLL